MALLDVRAVAEPLDCSPRHGYRLADSGLMPAPIKLGSLVRWRHDGPGGLREWIESGCKPVRR
jgi:predicted DNA-binding transcriptional regulator AlpA